MYYDAYEDLLALRHREYWLKGGRGSGKSSFAAMGILRGMLADPDANCVSYRRVANTLKDSVYATFGWAVQNLGLERLFRFKLSPLEIVYLPTGQRILFRGADDPLKSKSLALKKGHFKYLWFEEASEFRCAEDLRSIVQSVLRGSDRGAMICTYNPPRSALHWINALSAPPDSGRFVLHTTYRDMPRQWLGERFLQEAEALEKTNERAYKNEYLGEITGSGGRVFENLRLEPIAETALQCLDRRYFGLDFGFAQDPDALTEWAFDSRRRELWAVRESVHCGQSPQRLAEEIRRMAGKSVVYCDSADARMISLLKAEGISAVGAKKGPGSREQGFRWLQTLPAIHVDPARTPQIAREMSAYEYARDRQGRFISAYPDGDDHTLDSCRYALEREINRRVAGTRKDVY